VLTASALTGAGVVEVWDAITEAFAAATASGAKARRRSEQARSWMWSEVSDTLMERFRADPAVREQLDALEREVVAGTVSPSAAAARLLDAFRG
jgi:LAO/AO transport system kinase